MQDTTHTNDTMATPLSLQKQLAHIGGSTLLALAWSIFAYLHLQAFVRTHEYSLLLFCLSETLVAYFFLTRTHAQSVTQSTIAWIVSTLGTFAPFLFTPVGSVVWSGGAYLVALGVSLQIVSVFSLNKSFGIVAACRTVKTSGLYTLIRHPMYASYLVMFAGYVTLHLSVWNGVIGITAVVLMLMRIHYEELTLCENELYTAYQERVPWRLIPRVY